MKEFDPLRSSLIGVNLIEASAGTGKTTNISRIFLRLLLETGLTVDRILVVTFTESATEELKVRIRSDIRTALEVFTSGKVPPSEDGFFRDLYALYTERDSEAQKGGESGTGSVGGAGKAAGIDRLTFALSTFDEAAIHTIHGFCRRVLQDHAFESTALFDTELLTDQSTLLQDVLDDYWRGQIEKESSLFLSYLLKRDDPDRLRARIETHLARPLLEVRSAQEADDPERLEGEFQKLFDELVGQWPRAKREVSEVLLKAPGLNRRLYAPERMRDLLLRLDSFLSLRQPTVELPKGFERLSPAELERGTKRGFDIPAHSFFRLCGSLVEASKSLLAAYEIRHIRFVRDAFEYARSELPRRKRQRNVQYFDDLLLGIYHALRGSGGRRLAAAIRKRYAAALIDEFQDTDRLQYDIFRRIYPTGLLFLIGDPKQSIYSFRGADIYAYLRALGEAGQRFTLRKNWRSEEGLIRGLNTLFSSTARPFLHSQIQFVPAEVGEREIGPSASDQGGGSCPSLIDETGGRSAALQLWLIPREDGSSGCIPKYQAERRIMQAVCVETARLLGQAGEGKLKIGERDGGRALAPQDIAVLVRTNRQARQMQKALKDSGIAGVIHSTESLFLSEEAMQLQRALSGLADPSSEEAVRTALSTDIFGLKAEDLDRLTTDQEDWEKWTQRFREYHGIWQKLGFMRMIRMLMSEQEVRVRLLRFPDGQRRLTNLLHLIEILHGISLERGLGANSLLKWYTGALSGGGGGALEDSALQDELQLRLETDEPAVQIVTIHRSKGLGYPITFCPFLWDVSEARRGDIVFHDSQGNLCLDLGSAGEEENRRQQRYEDLAENLRLLYVALTRARSRCYLAWGNVTYADRSALAYLLHPPHNGSDLDEMVQSGVFSRLQAMSDELILRDLQSIGSRSAGAIEVALLTEVEEAPPGSKPAGGRGRRPEESPSAADLEPREFRAHIAEDFGVSSFSALLRRRKSALAPGALAPGALAPGAVAPGAAGYTGYEPSDVDLADHDTFLLGYQDEAGQRPEGILAFPRGTRAGNFFHSLFENLDFSQWADGAADEAALRQIESKLEGYGFESDWKPVIADMVGRVLSLTLTPGGFQLCRIPPQSTIREMEFLFPLERIDPLGLGSVFQKTFKAQSEGPEKGDRVLFEQIHRKVEELGFLSVRGFLKGFIDLVFRFENRYYLLDWKSNYLGASLQDYHRDRLERVMLEEYYFLQYHLYSLALHRYLMRHVEKYRYSSHFGGVFYLFLRGIDSQMGSDFGVFWDRPSEELILALDLYMRGERR